MQHPGSTEWPIWHDDTVRDRQELAAPSRHDIALARYLETQQAHRASTARRFDPVSVAASAMAAFAGRFFRSVPRPARGAAPTEFSKTLWGR